MKKPQRRDPKRCWVYQMLIKYANEPPLQQYVASLFGVGTTSLSSFTLPPAGVGGCWSGQTGETAAGAGEESSRAGAQGAGAAEQEHGHGSQQRWWAAADNTLKVLKRVDPRRVMHVCFLCFSPLTGSERQQLATSAQVLPHQALLLSGLWGGHPWGVPQDLQEDVLSVDVWVALRQCSPPRFACDHVLNLTVVRLRHQLQFSSIYGVCLFYLSVLVYCHVYFHICPVARGYKQNYKIWCLIMISVFKLKM